MNWSDVTLKQFHQLSLVKGDDPITNANKRLEILGIKPDNTDLPTLLSQVPNFISVLPSQDIQQTYKIAGVDFHPFVNFTTMNPSRFLDIHNTIKGRDPQDVREWPILLSLCLSKHGEPYDYQTHIDRKDWLYENMTFDQVYPLMVFFSKVWTLLQHIILDSSMEKLNIQLVELMKMCNESTGSSLSIGGGSHTSAK